ncbi:MAG: hypothetical protein F6J90_13455 [Moorea sp. SIOASIH]|uniref:hypothetical protein n=1 Tax=Moorena sp. SIOASIH TaxID=2607817 RepID=UPI0013BD0AFD|nr:hypothetical protein [Moorena sp. SIOASIH]NEO37273.1 hypothetical protein [Moorena sp. SIOASIH]
MEITDLNVSDMPVEPSKIELTLPTNINGPNPFVFTGCKGMMLEDFESLPVIRVIESSPIAVTTGL